MKTVSLLVVLCVAALALRADVARRGIRPAPLSEAFLAWCTNRTASVGGYVPSPLNLAHLPAAYGRVRAGRLSAAGELPSEWDSRREGWITSVKNQGVYGTCWAHGTMAALEAALLKNGAGAFDLSENHLARQVGTGFLGDFQTGGDDHKSAAMLTAWADPLLEAQDPYPNPSSAAEASPSWHVQDIVWLPGRTNGLDNAQVKQAIMDYGAVAVSYYHENGAWNKVTCAYCCRKGMEANHEVTAIGWDDAFPATNFVSAPPGDGAFLVKNSWGEGAGLTNGCLWISYYDTSFCDFASAAYPMPEATNNYGRVFSHDENGCQNTYGTGEDETLWGANVFRPSATGEVAAVGFYALAPQTAYVLGIYTNVTDGAPVSGGLAWEQSGTLATAGYHTVPLGRGVPLDAPRQRFSVVLRLTTPGYGFPVPVDESVRNYCRSRASSGESFLSMDGLAWEDVSEDGINCCIKAYTRYGSDGLDNVRLRAYVDDGEGCGLVTPAEAYVPVGGSATFTASTDHPFARYETNGVFASSEPVFTWPDVQTDGDIVAFFRATNFCVDASSGDDGQDGWTWLTAKRSLSAATDLAGPGDVVYVRPGVYAGLVSRAMDVAVTAVEGPSRTVIDGGWTNSCVYDAGDEIAGRPSRFEGFTLRNGCVSDMYVGGNACFGVYVNCVFSNGVAGAGGGAGYASLTNCLVVENWADYYGGGAFECDLTGCTVANNRAMQYGGGAFLYEGFAVNTLVANNVCARGFDRGHDVYGEAYWSMVASLSDVDARFVDAAHGDWRLTARSPALDAGSNDRVPVAFDLDGTNRICGARVDIGCYEYAHAPSGWPVPSVAPGASAEAEASSVSNALAEAGFPASVASSVTTAADYLKMADWAERRGVSASDLAASPTPLLLPALDAEGLSSVASNDLVVSSCARTSNDVSPVVLSLRLSLPAYDASKADARLLRLAIGAVGAEALSGTWSADALSVSVAPAADGIDLTVAPPAGPQYFVRPTAR